MPSGNPYGGYLSNTLCNILVHEAIGKGFKILHMVKPLFQAPFTAKFYRTSHTHWDVCFIKQLQILPWRGKYIFILPLLLSCNAVLDTVGSKDTRTVTRVTIFLHTGTHWNTYSVIFRKTQVSHSSFTQWILSHTQQFKAILKNKHWIILSF